MSETATVPEITEEFRKTRTVHWWGYDSQVTPAVVDQHFGDGRQLIAIQPLNTRPNYYLIRIHSRTDLGSDKWCDEILDDVTDAIIDQYSEKEREREYLAEDLSEQGIEPTAENTDLAGNEDRLDWPVLSLDSGVAWWTVARFKRGKWK